MGRSVERAILEGIRRKEDSEMQMYATEPPGAMGEEKKGKLCPKCDRTEMSVNADGLSKCPKCGYVGQPSEACAVKDDANNAPPGGDMEFTIDESGPLDENEWMTLDEMELECVECAGKMRDRKMTRIKRSEAQECMGRYGKKKPDDEE